ncbi:sensor histidine kinase KdpD [Allomuricauda sp. SCSIO 65647]|uniref:sensor histidine kinase n=1 Tax=Allomuricauda sp. SCSIO 65647 TaxID=2908843 RepID=UPI001F3282D9|nr:HAMP domain-containing sensor histidine kinase [Muricauda sp. SCSIO 65647]UJH69117.1 HAMP domain-containing histidine kinase [Muricauda sp. SCSIO 65647]
MNLVRKTNTYYLIFLAFLFPVMIAVDYYFIQYLVNSEVEEILLHERERIDFHLDKEGVLPPSNYLLQSTPIDNGAIRPEKFNDTLIYEAYADKQLPYKIYTFTSSINAQPVKITLRHVLLEIHELIWLLFITTSFVILLLVIGLYFINREIYKWAWNPFFRNLSKLKQYNVTQKESIHLNTSSISEFEELNEVITTLMDQVKKDFQNLKEFNENISHEIQTPLAIIRNKVVLLLESNNLDKKELARVEAVYQETNKLSKIGKALTLISRIENQEFRRLDRVDVHAIIGNILSNMQEIINFKNLNVTTELHPVTIECDHILADILLTNLIKNAVQHNKEGGSINMLLNEDKFEITNTGEISEIATEKLFRRFQRGSSTKDSLGLGLAINQKICDIYGFRLAYDRNEEIHTFSLFFKG